MPPITRVSLRTFPELNLLANKKKKELFEQMALKAIECPNDVCHSHHGGHAVDRSTMETNLNVHGREWCERLAERIYEMSIDTFSQTVMPSLHSSGWQRQHLDWEFKLDKKGSEPDQTLVDGIINATESFLRSSEVHRLFIQELVQGTFAEAEADTLRSIAVKKLVETEVLAMLEEHKEDLLDRVAGNLLDDAKGDFDLARSAASESLEEVEHLLVNHSEAI